MMDRFVSRDLTRYLGSKSSAVGLILFFLGAAGALTSVILGAAAFDWRADDKGYLLVPIWSLIAIPLGLTMRRGSPNSALSIFANCWLVLAIGTMLYFKVFG